MLDELWRRLGIAEAIGRRADGRRVDRRVTSGSCSHWSCSRWLEPGSKLAASQWAAERVALPGCRAFDDDAVYAAMDFLLEALEIAGGVLRRSRTC